MKNFSYLLFFICLHIHAQDTIIKLNNDRIVCNVIKVGNSLIEYKLDTTKFQIPIPNVKEIRYSNGVIEEPKLVKNEFNNSGRQTGLRVYNNRYYLNNYTISENELYEELSLKKSIEIEEEIQIAKKSKQLQYTGFIGIPLGISAITLYLVQTDQLCLLCQTRSLTKDERIIFNIISIGAVSCPIASAFFKANRTKHNARAVAIYNQKF